ncbi:unnamed protein product [Sphagnum jensenii]|uniref:Aspartic peptidase DDI1-type domain-containing protein n=1 Tax=Sphagnum jensenii TaxID=128206 RepID=A0ABP1BNF4_9BRYO
MEAANTQVTMVSAIPTLRRLCISKTHRSETLHLSMEVNQSLIEGLVDIGASMSVMAAAVVRELGLMHLVTGSEAYKMASEEGLIQVRRGPGVDVEVLPLTMDTDEQLTELESKSDSGSSEESDEENQTGVTVEGESEFGNIELEDLVLKEGPQ